MPGRIITLTRAIAVAARALPAPASAARELGSACGAYAAEDLRAPRDVPRGAAAACDAFVTRAGVGECAARIGGSYSPSSPPPGPPAPGEAFRVEKGTPVPPGTAVVPVIRACLVATGTVRLGRASPEAVRARGAVIRRGKVLVGRGERIDERTWALLAASEVPRVETIDIPPVQVVAVGSELGREGSPEVTAGYMARLLGRLGIPACHAGPLPDDCERIRREVVSALPRGLVLLCGGSGAGLTDRSMEALRPGGVRIAAEGINVSPGETSGLAVGLGGSCLFLPGEFTVAPAVAHALVVPVIARWLGLRIPAWPAAPRYRLAEPWTGPPDRYVIRPCERAGGVLKVLETGSAGGGFLAAEELAVLVPGEPERNRAILAQGPPAS